MKIAVWILFALLALFPIAMFGQTDISYGAKTGFALSLHYGTKADPQDLKVKLAMRPGAYAGAWLDLNILPNLAQAAGHHQAIQIPHMLFREQVYRKEKCFQNEQPEENEV